MFRSIKKMSSRAPRYSEPEMHALVDGCIKRWKTLSSNFNSDRIKESKETAWKTVTTEVNAVNTSGAARKWEDVRRKLQVEKSNVKKKLQEIRRKRAMTGNVVGVPQLNELEEKISSLIREEELVGIKGAFTIGLPGTNGEPCAPTTSEQPPRSEAAFIASQESTTATVQGNNTETQTPHKNTNSTTAKKTTAEIQHENLVLQNTNLKRQAIVLDLQEKYYRLKLSRLQGPYLSLLTDNADE